MFGITNFESIRIVQVYDVFDLAEDPLFAPVKNTSSLEQVTDHALDEAVVQSDFCQLCFLLKPARAV